MDCLNERQTPDDSAPKRNSIVSEIVAMWVENYLSWIKDYLFGEFPQDWEERDEVQHDEEPTKIESQQIR